MNEQSLNKHWHTIDAQEALKRLDVSEDGLSQAQAGERLEKAGPNTLEVEEGSGPLTLLLRQVHNPLIYLLADTPPYCLCSWVTKWMQRSSPG